jgi:predicted nucleic acid-binding protein
MKVCIDTNFFISNINKEQDAEACKAIAYAIEQHEFVGGIGRPVN